MTATTMIRSMYSERFREPVVFTKPSRAKQSFVEECDINGILAQWSKTGLINHVNKYAGEYTTLPDSSDYHSSLNHIIAAQEAFASLPAHVRNKFRNDPGQFLEFVSDPANGQEMFDMGLLTSYEPAEVPPSPKGAEGTSGGSSRPKGAKNASAGHSETPTPPASSGE